jgi:sulfonate transport system permease protein
MKPFAEALGYVRYRKPLERNKMVQSKLTQWTRALWLPFGVLALWFIAADFALVPKPLDVVARIFALMANGELETHIFASGTRLLEGLLLGGLPAVALGILVGMSRQLEDYLAPTLRFLTPVPVLAWMPLVILFLGVDEAAKVALLAIGVFFVMYSATAGAVRSVDIRYIEVARLYRKGLRQTVSRVILPACTPAIFDGLRSAVALSWIILVAVEIVASRNGLGWLLWDARTFGRTVDAYVAMVVVGALGLISDSLIGCIRNRIVTWRNDFRGF